MKKAVDLFARHKDFRAFCKSPDKFKHTICNITSSKLFRNASGDRIRFQISSNRFLTSMVRTMAGVLLEIGRGQFTLEDLEKSFESKELPEFITPAYPQGLYLSKVTYRYLDIPSRTDFVPLMHNAEIDWVKM